MLICGVEEPIQPNGYMLEVDEQWQPGDANYNRIEFTDPRLNRYSFVHLPDEGGDGYYPEEATANFRHLLGTICDQSDMPLTGGWCGRYFPTSEAGSAFWAQVHASVCRRAEQGNLAARKQLERLMHTPEELAEQGWKAKELSQSHFALLGEHGWDAYHDDELQVATKPFTPSRYWLNYFDREPTDDPVHTLTFLVIGTAPPPQVFAAPLLRPTMLEPGKFAPGPSFLAWLAEQPFSIAYIAEDTVGRPGLVIVGTLRIDATALLAAGMVRKIDSRLGLVWNYPPFPQV